MNNYKAVWCTVIMVIGIKGSFLDGSELCIDVVSEKQTLESRLYVAWKARDSKTLDLLIRKKGDINHVFQPTGLSLLGLTSDYSQDDSELNMVKWLVENGANINQEHKDKTTPLFYASNNRNNRETIQYLVENKANVNHINQYGHTPVSYAYSRKDKENLFELIKLKGNVHYRRGVPSSLFFIFLI